MMAAAESLSWSDLPPELLGLVLKHLPSLADRVRLRAVCQPWRSNARLQSLPPPLPWLTLPDGTFLSIPDGEIIQMAVADGACCCGSIDNWLFLMQNDGGCSLTNPFSKATLDLPKLATVWRRDWLNANEGFNPLFYKLVVPSPLDSSPESLVAVLILDSANSSTVCICQPPVATDISRGRHMEPSRCLFDVAFFNGKLYGVAFGDKLVIFEIGYDLGCKPKISATECIINSRDDDLWDLPQSLSNEKAYMWREYLVECCGGLLKADLSTNPGHWRRVNKLGGQALFVGRHCSKSFAAKEYNGIQEDCIYFMCDYPWPDSAADPLRDSGVYNLRNGTITPLLSQTATVPQHHGGHWRPTWFFPADSI
uniref:F-box domain-containing protein n=1 Tax=Setaria italica TaxID=4555 RepID=K3XXR1_SETIT